MKARMAWWIGGLAASSLLVLVGCGGDGGMAQMPTPPAAPPAPPAPPSAPMTMNLDTAAVLVIVQTKTSETASPFQVDGGAVAVVPVGDETGTPISVNGG